MKSIRNIFLICILILGCTCCTQHRREVKRYMITDVELLDTLVENSQHVTVFPKEPFKMYLYRIRLSDENQDTVINLKSRVNNMKSFIGDTIVLCNDNIHNH